MSSWNTTTEALTGYTDDWETIIKGLKTATEDNIKALKDMNGDGGSIKELDKSLRKSAKDMYKDFIEERRRYRDELEDLIDTIRDEIESAVEAAAEAIKKAAESISAGSGSGDGSGSSGSGTGGTEPGGRAGGGSNGDDLTNGILKGWKAEFAYSDGKTFPHTGIVSPEGKATYDEVYQNWLDFLKKLRVTDPGITSWGLQYFSQGGLANFTGPAWLDGTKSNPERILSPRQTKLFESMISSLEQTANNSNINVPFGSSYNIFCSLFSLICSSFNIFCSLI